MEGFGWKVVWLVLGRRFFVGFGIYSKFSVFVVNIRLFILKDVLEGKRVCRG